MRSTLLLLTVIFGTGCRTVRPPSPMDSPAEAARHRAALATVTVSNETTSDLKIAFRTTASPVQEIVIGNVPAGGRVRLAPVPASEPIILIARKTDGRELLLEARSFPLDAEWLWEIPREATFTAPTAK